MVGGAAVLSVNDVAAITNMIYYMNVFLCCLFTILRQIPSALLNAIQECRVAGTACAKWWVVIHIISRSGIAASGV